MARENQQDQILTGEHHRRPRSIGGTESPGNVSLIVRKIHRNWHILVGNMNASQICNLLNHLDLDGKPENVKLNCSFINGTQVKGRGENNSKNAHKIEKAWRDMFPVKNLSFTEKIDYINNVLLDPSYHLYIIEK